MKRSDLAEMTLLAPEDRPTAIPAWREDGKQVLLRTDTFDAGDEVSTFAVQGCFIHADGLQRSGQFSLAARQLKECRRGVAPDERRARLERDLGVAIGGSDRAELERAIRDLDEQRAELSQAIEALEAGGGAGVSIRALHMAAPYLAAPSSEVRVRPKTRVRTAALVLAGIGGALAAGSIIAGVSIIGANRDNGFVPAAVGIPLGTASGALLLTSAILAGAARHSAETSRAIARRQLEPGPQQLAIARARARRGAIGSGVAGALSLALVASGAVLIADAIRTCPEQNDYCPHGDFAPRGHAGYDQGVAGIVLASVGGLGFSVSLSVMAAELAVYRNTGRASPRVSANARPPMLLPWFTRDAGGLGMSGSF